MGRAAGGDADAPGLERAARGLGRPWGLGVPGSRPASVTRRHRACHGPHGGASMSAEVCKPLEVSVPTTWRRSVSLYPAHRSVPAAHNPGDGPERGTPAVNVSISPPRARGRHCPRLGSPWPGAPLPSPQTFLRVAFCASSQKPGWACHSPGGWGVSVVVVGTGRVAWL